jgi:hypothetical protein
VVLGEWLLGGVGGFLGKVRWEIDRGMVGHQVGSPSATSRLKVETGRMVSRMTWGSGKGC